LHIIYLIMSVSVAPEKGVQDPWELQTPPHH
jgi:hypothetical protein